MIKAILKSFFILLKGDHFLRYFNKTPRILFWHGVHNKPHQFIESESIDKKNFISQIRYLNKYFNIISIDDFYNRYIRNEFLGNEVVLTFDDGYKNNKLQV